MCVDPTSMPYVTFLVDFTKDVDFMAHFGVSGRGVGAGELETIFKAKREVQDPHLWPFKRLALQMYATKKRNHPEAFFHQLSLDILFI